MTFQREDLLQESVCAYIRAEYPTVIFTCEPSGLRVAPKQRGMLSRMRSGTKLPDLWILEPRGRYHGLILELKTIKGTPYRKDGTLRRGEHIQGQAAVLQLLLEKGYMANFAVGEQDALTQIKNYMDLIL